MEWKGVHPGVRDSMGKSCTNVFAKLDLLHLLSTSHSEGRRLYLLKAQRGALAVGAHYAVEAV